MGLTKFIKQKIEGKKESPERKALKAAEKLKFEQQVYEAEQKGYRGQKLIEAEKKGRQKARTERSHGSGIMGTLGKIGDIASNVETGINVMEKKMFSGDIGFGELWQEPKRKKKRKRR